MAAALKWAALQAKNVFRFFDLITYHPEMSAKEYASGERDGNRQKRITFAARAAEEERAHAMMRIGFWLSFISLSGRNYKKTV